MQQEPPRLWTLPDEQRVLTVDAAAILTEAGLPIRPQTLTKLRCVGGGPEFQTFGRRPVYTLMALRTFAKCRLGDPVRNTSQRLRVASLTDEASPPIEAGTR